MLLVLVSAILAVSVITGCSENKSTQASSNENNETVLRIAAQPYPLYTPVYVAYRLGYLDEELNAVGAKYEWKSFKSGPLVNEAVAAGEADLGFMADLPAIIAKSTGLPIEVVSNVAYGEKGIAVLAKADSPIKSVADLKGKKVAYATGVKRGNMVTYAVSDYANKNPKVIEAYIKALNRADEVIKNEPEKAAEAVAEDFGVNKELMLKIIPNFTFSTEFTEDDIAEIKNVKDFSLESGIISKDVDIDSFINKKYLDAIK